MERTIFSEDNGVPGIPPVQPPIPGGRFLPTESKIPKGGWRVLPRGIFMPSESKIPLGGWREWFPTFSDVYRTLDGRHFFEFEFHSNSDGSIDVDILNMPSYPARLTNDLHETHRLSSNHGNGYRICFGDSSAINTIEIAQEFAGIWAENTMKLIKEGTPFPNI